VRIKI